MKVLITGSNGFIGKNLMAHLQEIENVQIVTFGHNEPFDKLEKNIKDIDFIFHLAGVNRPRNNEEYYEGNENFTKKLVDLVKDKNPNIPFVFTSSIHAEKDNEYGKSKKKAEKYIMDNINNHYIFRLHNVFGKWCKPNYNSVIATFCYNIAHDKEIQIDDPNKELELIYIDDICEIFCELLKGKNNSQFENGYYYIPVRYKYSLKTIADLLYEFKNDMKSIYVPNTGNEFVKKLFSTYISYLPLDDLAIPTKQNIDQRGSFTELVRTMESGQVSISVSQPGIIRGNHYHHTKIERFVVIKGKAKISFKSIVDNTYYEFIVSEKDIKIITIPVGYTHNIENIGNDEMILLIWCNELFDENKPDTFFKEVKNNE